MALGMSAADVAVSTKGINDLTNSFKNNCKKILDNLDSSTGNAKTLKNTIKSYWSGADCDAFIADLDAAFNSLKTKITSYQNQVINALNNYDKEFTNMQKNTYKSGTVKI